MQNTRDGDSRRSVLIGAAATAATGMAGKTLANAQGNATQKAVTPAERRKVAFLMDEAATMIDFAGPWEVFQDVMATSAPRYHLFTVAPRMMTYNTTGNIEMRGREHRMTGIKFIPDYTFADCPQPDVIVMGAQIGFDTPEKLNWLRRAAPAADTILSVCTGNFIAAHAGLLDGKKATTHHDWFDRFERAFPKVQLVREDRVVDNGKFVSAGGLTASIDGALHVVRKHHGDAVAREVVTYMEYRGEGWKA